MEGSLDGFLHLHRSGCVLKRLHSPPGVNRLWNQHIGASVFPRAPSSGEHRCAYIPLRGSVFEVSYLVRSHKYIEGILGVEVQFIGISCGM